MPENLRELIFLFRDVFYRTARNNSNCQLTLFLSSSISLRIFLYIPKKNRVLRNCFDQTVAAWPQFEVSSRSTVLRSTLQNLLAKVTHQVRSFRKLCESTRSSYFPFVTLARHTCTKYICLTSRAGRRWIVNTRARTRSRDTIV